MNCKKCGALLHEGDTFCRTCATPVQESYIKSNTNIATLDFSKVNNENSNVKVIEDVIDTGNNNYITTKTKDINNKDLLDKDPNNKVKATIINISGLILLLIIIFVLIILFLNVLSNLGK